MISTGLPIDMDILKKRTEIPKKIAKISYADKDKAIHFLRLWGEGKVAITELHNNLSQEESK